jgi:hypothetical protein
LRLDENKELEVSNLSYHNFVEVKILVYNAMRLIDDKIGIFHKTSVRNDEGTEYYNIWEDVFFTSKPRHVVAMPFSTIPSSEEVEMGISLLWEPGDKIGIFFNERRKFFSYVQHFRLYQSRLMLALSEDKCPVGSLFLLPACFYFSPEGESNRVSSEAIQRAINRVERFVGNYTWVLAHDNENDEAFNNFFCMKIILMPFVYYRCHNN